MESVLSEEHQALVRKMADDQVCLTVGVWWSGQERGSLADIEALLRVVVGRHKVVESFLSHALAYVRGKEGMVLDPWFSERSWSFGMEPYLDGVAHAEITDRDIVMVVKHYRVRHGKSISVNYADLVQTLRVIRHDNDTQCGKLKVFLEKLLEEQG